MYSNECQILDGKLNTMQAIGWVYQNGKRKHSISMAINLFDSD